MVLRGSLSERENTLSPSLEYEQGTEEPRIVVSLMTTELLVVARATEA